MTYNGEWEFDLVNVSDNPGEIVDTQVLTFAEALEMNAERDKVQWHIITPEFRVIFDDNGKMECKYLSEGYFFKMYPELEKFFRNVNLHSFSFLTKANDKGQSMMVDKLDEDGAENISVKRWMKEWQTSR